MYQARDTGVKFIGRKFSLSRSVSSVFSFVARCGTCLKFWCGRIVASQSPQKLTRRGTLDPRSALVLLQNCVFDQLSSSVKTCKQSLMQCVQHAGAQEPGECVQLLKSGSNPC